MKFLSKEQRESALEEASESNRDHFILKMLLNTGLRKSEFLKIVPQDINFDELHIIVIGKGKKIRNVDISSKLRNFIKLFIKANKIGEKDRLITLSTRQIERIVKKYTGLSPHCMRHTYAIMMLRNGHSLEYLRRQLGHESLDYTQVYLRFADFEEEKKKLGELFE